MLAKSSEMAAKKETEPPMREVGARFREARKALGLSQGEIAEEAGLGQPEVSRLEQGERGLETNRLIALLQAARRKGASIDYVMTGIGSVLIGSDDPTLLGELRRLIDARSAQRSPHQLPAPGDGRKKS